MSIAETQIIKPKLGEGIYFLKDISTILGLDLEMVRRWIAGYWDEEFKTTMGSGKSRAINFYSLIEFYTFFKFREQGVSAQELKKAHRHMREEMNCLYPFATADAFNVESRKKKKHVWYEFDGSKVKADGKHQISLSFVQPFIDRIEYDKNNLAKRFFPLANSKNIVVDPERQFGQPIINGTSIKTNTIYHLHLGGESNKNICRMYDLTEDVVLDVIEFHLKHAA